jgi:nucleoside-diphosphate-sugar epimerase
MVGLKFGTTSNPAKTWATNTLIPSYCAQYYAGARIVALSSGNVYPFVPVDGPGSREDDPLIPVGEYANSCIARERVFEYCANLYGNPMVLIRLSYALDLRYGVLVDIAQKVHSGDAIDLTTGTINCIWQGDANEMILRSLAHTRFPPWPINLTGVKHYSVREIAKEFGAIFDKDPVFIGDESETALISNTELMVSTLGHPNTSITDLIYPTAIWVRSGGYLYNKKTHFEVRNGDY